MYDLILYNGKIHTMVSEEDVVEAVAIWDTKIVCVGTSKEMKSLSSKKFIDLEGRTVIPGMIDAHMHLYMDYFNRMKVNLREAKCFDDVVSMLKEKLPEVKQGQWLSGCHLHLENLKEQKFPTTEILDQISTEIPITVASFCSHANMVNSKVLEIAGIGKDFVSDLPGIIELDEQGYPTGIVREETYQLLIDSKRTQPTMEDVKEDMAAYIRDRAAEGLTTLHTNILGDPYDMRLFQELEKDGQLASRIVYYPSNIPHLSMGMVTGFGSDMIRIGGIKMFMDGSVGAETAAMKEPYIDKDTCGDLLHDQEEANAKVKEIYDAGNDVAVHAIGDRAIEVILNAFENAYKKEIGWKQRFYLIHGYFATEEQMERMKKLPLVVSTQPVFIRNFVGMVRPRLGQERTERCFPQKKYLQHGVLVAASSDAPVQDTNPFYGIYCSVTRKSENADEIIGAEEGISVYEAVETYTKLAAYVGKEETIKGTIESGKLADLVVLDRDIFTIDPEQLYLTKVERTILGGKIVYEK